MAAKPRTGSELTDRERTVLRLCAAGRSDLEIAAELRISVFTVGNHIQHILRKTATVNRAQAVAWGFQNGVIRLEGGRDETEDEGALAPAPQRSAAKEPRAEVAARATTGGSAREVIPAISVLPRAKDSQLPQLERAALGLVRGLQRALLEPRLWKDTLEDFARVFDCHLPMVTWFHLPSRGARSVTFAPAMGEDYRRRYDEHYARLNPLVPLIGDASEDFFAVMEDYPVEESFYRHPFYLEHCRPLDVDLTIAWTIFTADRWGAELFLGRSFAHARTPRENRELGVMLFPYVRHTLRSLWEKAFSRPHENDDGATPQAVGEVSPADRLEDARRAVLFLDGRGRIIIANALAEEMLLRGTWLRTTPGGLAGAGPLDTERIRDAVSRAVRAADGLGYVPPRSVLLHPRRSADGPALASVTPLLADAEPSPSPVSRARVLVTISETGIA